MLILVRGLPGSGKSTFVHQYFPHLFHVEMDMFHMHDGSYCFDPGLRKESIAWAGHLVELALSKGFDVVVSTCMLKKEHVDYYVDLGNRHHHEWFVISCDGNFGTVHNVPKEDLRRMAEQWEDYPGEFYPEDFIRYQGLKPQYLPVK